jgi:ribosomal protein S18 acetylase RimI-like enzyme
MKSTITVRLARNGDTEFLFQVYASTRSEELARIDWTEEEKRAFLMMQFNAQRQDYLARFPESEQLIVLDNGTPAGRLWVNGSEEEIRLLDIALLPGYRNTGIGTLLLKHLQKEARATSKPLHHSVHNDNLDALRFYHRLGFKVVEDFGTHSLMEWTSPIPE